MKRYIKASYIEEDGGAQILDQCVQDLQSIKYKLELIIEYNQSYPNSYSKEIIKELKLSDKSLTTSLTHLYNAANNNLDSLLGPAINRADR